MVIRGAVKETHNTQFLSASTLAAALPHEASVKSCFQLNLICCLASIYICLYCNTFASCTFHDYHTVLLMLQTCSNFIGLLCSVYQSGCPFLLLTMSYLR